MLQKFSIFNTIFNDAPQPWQLSFQDSANMQRYLLLILYCTIFWNVLIANYSNLYIIIELLEKINWIELSEEKIIIVLNYYYNLRDYTYEMFLIQNFTLSIIFQNSTALVISGNNISSLLGQLS
jgi:hypothetical protein